MSLVDNVLSRLVGTSVSCTCMLNNCLQCFKVSLRTLTTANSCLTHLFHDCTNVVNHTIPVKCDVRHPSRFTGNV